MNSRLRFLSIPSDNLSQLSIRKSNLYHTRDGLNVFEIETFDKYGLFVF